MTKNDWDGHKFLDAVLVSSEERNKRVEICKSCDRLNKLNFCVLCGCFMPVKTWLKSKSCPANKW